MELYFLDDGSLIINTPKSLQLIEDVEIVKTIGCHYLSGLSGKETYAILVDKFCASDSNVVSCCEESNNTGDNEDK